MPAAQNQASEQVTLFFRRLTLAQKLTLGAVSIAVVLAIVALVSFVNRPSYSTLFSNLNEQDASKIVDKLKEKTIPYQLEDGGKTIKIPKDQVYDLRLSLAGEGLPQSSIIGYELFDRASLGVSDFVQKINYRRALEGELARTILQIDEVEAARVHLVVPEKVLFKEDEKPATASVILKMKSGNQLPKESVKGIAHLVASSIEGLDAGNVTIVDSRGVLLSDNRGNSLAATTSTQYELQHQVESYLATKAQSLLESVVGSGNALVQVTADLDFRQVERNQEKYDPDNTAIRSESIQEEKTPQSDSAAPATRTSSLTNYEVNKTVEHIVENLGNVKRLSVAAVVNGIPKAVQKDGQTVEEFTPRPQDEMNKLTDLVKKSVGFDPTRNDEVSVTNLSFGVNGGEQDLLYKQTPGSDWYGWGVKIFVIGAMLGGVLIIRSLLSRLRVRVPGLSHEQLIDLQKANAALRAKKELVDLPPMEDEVSPDAMLRAQRRDRVTDYIRQKPSETSRLLKVWLSEE
ncbi:MAG: flagellar basal-body MS-ring/collar protein FliF [Bacteroidota bacterium]